MKTVKIGYVFFLAIVAACSSDTTQRSSRTPSTTW